MGSWEAPENRFYCSFTMLFKGLRPTRRPKKQKNKNQKQKMKIYKNKDCQKHVILVILGLREYQNRIQHVHKSAHAKYELCIVAGRSAHRGQKPKNNW